MEEEKSFLLRDLVNQLSLVCQKNNLNESSSIYLHLMTWKLHQQSLQTIRTFDQQEALINDCLRILAESPFWLNTLKLQIFWSEKYRTKDEIKRSHHETIYKSVLPFLTEIVAGTLVKTVDRENLYRKMVIFVILFSGLGSPTQQPIIRETKAALCSIFNNSEMDNFLTLSRSSKEQQLFDFARIVTGIRLFNKDCKKGGEGINDLPSILTQGVRATKERIDNFKQKVDRKILNMVKVLLITCGTDESDDNVEPEMSAGVGVDKEDLENMKSHLTYIWQIEFCLRDIMRDLDESLSCIDQLVEKLRSILVQVHEIVRYRVAVATVQVFPLFIQLSNVWVKMQEEVDILSEINNNFVELSTVTKSLIPTSIESDLKCATAVMSSDETNITYDSATFHLGVEVSSFSAVSNNERLQYEGFCGWTMAHTNGVLVTGNISIGVLVFEGRFYCFASSSAAKKWAKAPKMYITRIVELVKTRPDLIKLLNMDGDLKITEPETEIEPDVGNYLHTEEEVEIKMVASTGVQTELHPIPSYISRHHTFSQWELKRRAIRLAKLSRCVTKSQQTINRTSFQPEVGVQVTTVEIPVFSSRHLLLAKGSNILRDCRYFP
ncbi:hypothetical protein RUM44_002296 [Polyplax serrata]|uniref:Cilia- and flagella-associated protein 206 n=1 Tax=Polyplax serrata TaxID=468196 RepID=A0ABR1AMI7_POLSC